MTEPQQTLNIPQLLAFILIAGLTLRWLLSSSRSSPTSPTPIPNGRNTGGRQISESHVQQIRSMFPQLSRREVAWELLRNGDSVQATIERVLSGRPLESPPPSYQPPLSPSLSAHDDATQQRDHNARPPPRSRTSQHSDLITRYNLSSKLSSASADTFSSNSIDMTGTSCPNKQAWSANKDDRHRLLRQRREEMILQARRRMAEKDGGV